MENQSGAVLLITHKRTEQLRKVLANLEKSWRSNYRELVVILHIDQYEVKKIVESISWIKAHVIEVDRHLVASTKEAINTNVFEGLTKSFSLPGIDFVTVVEDDILVASDFLEFNTNIINKEIGNEFFKGVNGFSGALSNIEKSNLYGKFRYGFGWGWTIPRRTWESVNKRWQYNINSHWDALIEGDIRTGYVVMPHNSRIMNLGFDETATHTYSGSVLEEKLLKSFSDMDHDHSIKDYVASNFEINWRDDALKFVDTKTFRGKLIQQLFVASSRVHVESKKIAISKFMSLRVKGLFLRLAALFT